MAGCDSAYLRGRVVDDGVVERRVAEVVGDLQAGAVVKEDLDEDDETVGYEDEVKDDATYDNEDDEDDES